MFTGVKGLKWNTHACHFTFHEIEYVYNKRQCLDNGAVKTFYEYNMHFFVEE